jgi:hypothetical protein
LSAPWPGQASRETINQIVTAIAPLADDIVSRGLS